MKPTPRRQKGMKRQGIFWTFMIGILWLLVACGGLPQASSAPYTPQTRTLMMVTVPLLVKESTGTFPFLNKDFAKGGVLSGKEVYAFSPDHLTAYQGDTLDITIVNPEDDPHTFVLSDFNVNVLLPPQTATKVRFVANKVGVFTFLCDVASHQPFMTGQLTVLPDSSATA
jgi:plastocyanin